LKEIGKLQLSKNNQEFADISPKSPRKLKYLLSVMNRVSHFELFSTFCAAYFFNQSSFAFLQKSLFPLIVTVNLDLQLYYKRTNFKNDQNGILTAHSYWKEISDYSLNIYESLIKYIPFLSSNVSKLIKFIITNKYDIDLFFFECFINQILDHQIFLVFFLGVQFIVIGFHHEIFQIYLDVNLMNNINQSTFKH
jgi:hypothetical protein